MPKVYKDINVYDAFVERVKFVFSEFKHIYISFSGGKDSSVLLQLVNSIAKSIDRKFDVLYIDFEAQYKATIQHVYELKSLSQINDFYHFCLPLENEDNGSSIFRPTWIPWDENEKDLWVRDMPKDAINIETVDERIFKRGQEWEDLLKQFPKYLLKKYKCDKIACLTGERTDESFNRFRAYAFSENIYSDIKWSNIDAKGVIKFTPLYDWSVQDIWHAVYKFQLKYNQVYEMLWKDGIPISKQRICQPFGQDQRQSLSQWAKLEPDTWAKIVNRVSGANFGALYSKTTLLGHNGTSKPEYMSWEQYAVFLLESIGLYSQDLRDHYIRKLKILFDYLEKEASLKVNGIQDEHSSDTEDLKSWISWKRIAITIEKNDFQCRGLQYGLTKADRETMLKLKKKWGTLLGLENYKTKEFINLAKEIGYERED